MSIQKAKDIHSKLESTVSKFLSPSIREYFVKKIDRDYRGIVNSGSENIEKYISERKELNESLNRVVGIYNMYRDNTSTL